MHREVKHTDRGLDSHESRCHTSACAHTLNDTAESVVVAWQAEECRGAEAPSAEGWGYRTAQEAEGGGRRLRGAGIAAQRRT